MSNNPSLESRMLKGCGNKDFVKKTANWSWVGTGRSLNSPAWSFSLTMWQSISRCFVRSWKTGLAAMCIALWLSQYNTWSLTQLIWRSLSKQYNIHWSSHVADVIALYSASEEDLDTVGCFFVFQDMRYWPKKKHWPEIEPGSDTILRI
jgi:hypothetical protein